MKDLLKFIFIPFFIILFFTGAYGTSSFDDEFDSTDINSKWSWIREDNTKWSLSENSGSMRIYTQRGDFWNIDNIKNILVQDAPGGDYEVITKVTINPQADYEQAMLLIYQDDNNYVRLDRVYVAGNGGNLIEFFANDNSNIEFIKNTATTIYLKIRKNGTTYSGFYSLDSYHT